MYTITPQDMEAIRELAASIPPVQRTVLRDIPGHQLLELGITAMDGDPVLSGLVYRVPVIVQANLITAISNAVRREGPGAMREVVDRLRSGRPMLTTMGTLMYNRNAHRAA